MSQYAERLIASDFDAQAEKVKRLGGVLQKRSYLQKIGVSRQTLWNWRAGKCAISRRAALSIEERTGGRLRSENLLARGKDERTGSTGTGRDHRSD